ncbi:cupin domain-containing protein [Terriglobus sp. TAA 43]|uniref:cupin domain-containing protein n=1 Tax=Terriglobus sp. TAA 43 TaxID=278961 RepID=UPI0006490158|nr:cupin domain-containing protein [Terriglobus sp. TAA 43]
MTKLLLALTLALPGHAAQVGSVTELLKKDLAGTEGKEGLMITVDIAPGETVPSHRHNAAVFAYVLEGDIITQIEGKTPLTLHAGQSFYEAPSDVHLPSRNLSESKPAKLLVFFVKDAGAPPTVVITPDATSHDRH